MFTRLRALMQATMDAFLAGNFPEAASHCDFPMQVTLGGKLILLATPTEMVQFLTTLSTERQAAGQVRSEAEIRSIELPRAGHFRVWVRWQHLDASGRQVDFTDLIYHCRDRGQRVFIVAVVATRLSLDQMAHYQNQRRFTV